MRSLVYAFAVMACINCAVFFLIGLHYIAFNDSKQLTCKSEFKDPCQEMHGLSTKDIRDRKPKYDRNLKQVVSTCEDK